MYRDGATLLDIAKAARLIGAFLEGVKPDAFCANAEKQSAVLHQITILGEAVRRLSREFRNQHGQIPWQQVAGMRDRVVHGYDKVDLTRVWSTATQEVPELLTLIEPLLPVEPSEGDGSDAR
jgi:uncharacterized protein with HEPN domain